MVLSDYTNNIHTKNDKMCLKKHSIDLQLRLEYYGDLTVKCFDL